MRRKPPWPRVALIARVWQRVGEREFEVRDAPLRVFHVEPHADGEGALVAFPLPEGRVLLRVASADAFQSFVAAAMREAVTHAKRFYKGDFDMLVEGAGMPPARGKRMVSFERDGQRILHAWCEEGILQTAWKPVELQMGLRLMVDEIARVAPR